MARGELVSDDVIVALVKERLEEPASAGGFVLDGFPRTVAQAIALDGLLNGAALSVVEIRVPDDELVRRVRGRRICEQCGTTVSAFDGDPSLALTCTSCGGRLVQRSDDSAQIVRDRLKVYWRETAADDRVLRDAADVSASRRSAVTGRGLRGDRGRGGLDERPGVSGDMIVCRSAGELERLARVNALVARVLAELKTMVVPGITTAEVDALAERRLREAGAEPAFKGYHGYPATICASVNEEVVHGIPSGRKLKEGDIVSVDLGAKLDGFYGDSAVTVPVGRVSADATKLLAVTEQALGEALSVVRAGARLSDIGAAVQRHVEAHGFSVVREFVGHGIGTTLHEEPQIPNYGTPGRGPRLAEGMVLAIEPMVNMGQAAVKVLGDGWTAVTKDGSLSAHFEHTVAVTADGCRVLTRTDSTAPVAA